MARQRSWEIEQARRKATEYAEKNQVDTALYLSPEGWDFVDIRHSAGIPIREIIRFARPQIA